MIAVPTGHDPVIVEWLKKLGIDTSVTYRTIIDIKAGEPITIYIERLATTELLSVEPPSALASAIVIKVGEKIDYHKARITEAAFRLMTVAIYGFASEWLFHLNNQFGGQDFWQPITYALRKRPMLLKASARTILEQFSRGEIPQLFEDGIVDSRLCESWKVFIENDFEGDFPE